jgi:hypothetical protein
LNSSHLYFCQWARQFSAKDIPRSPIIGQVS